MSRKVTAALLITAAVLTNATFTVLGMVFNYPDVLKEPAALGRTIAGRWLAALCAVSGVLVLAGVLSPLDLPVIDLANFIGYVLWSIWLVVFGLLLLRRPRTATAAPARSRSNAESR